MSTPFAVAECGVLITSCELAACVAGGAWAGEILSSELESSHLRRWRLSMGRMKTLDFGL